MTGQYAGFVCFTTLWIYTILKLAMAFNMAEAGFTTLWIYTILKPKIDYCPLYEVLLPYGFTLFSNFDFGGCKNGSVLLPYGFTLFSNWKPINDPFGRFYYLMDLHYSQTHLVILN